jgi:anti-anti-sigma factor
MVGDSRADDRTIRIEVAGLTVDRLVIGRAQVVRAVGEVDVQTVGALAEQLDDAVRAAAADEGVVIIDLCGVTFFGSNGLGELVACRQRCAKAGVALRIVADNRSVLRSIEITNVDRVLLVCPTVESALADACDPIK